jgi:hypothetical protein
LEGQLGPLASANWIPIPPIIRNELSARKAKMVMTRNLLSNG